MDLRGHGHSEGVRVDVADFDDYDKDLDVFLARIRQREPGKPLFVFAHSMGGAIVTLDLITRKPDLAGVVLTGPALAVDVSAFKILGTKFVAAISPTPASSTSTSTSTQALIPRPSRPASAIRSSTRTAPRPGRRRTS